MNHLVGSGLVNNILRRVEQLRVGEIALKDCENRDSMNGAISPSPGNEKRMMGERVGIDDDLMERKGES